MTWDAATWGFVGVIVGGLITGLLTLGVELIRANRAAALDGAKRRDDRQLGRDQFQRETLLELQGAVTNFATALGRLHSVRTPEAVAEASRAALLVGTLGSRVDDDLVRTASDKLVTTGAAVLKGEPVLAVMDEATRSPSPPTPRGRTHPGNVRRSVAQVRDPQLSTEGRTLMATELHPSPTGGHALVAPRVFVSSTVADFGDLRSSIKYLLEESGFQVALSEVPGFEHPLDETAREAAIDSIEGSDYYVLLVGDRYGSRFPTASRLLGLSFEGPETWRRWDDFVSSCSRVGPCSTCGETK